MPTITIDLLSADTEYRFRARSVNANPSPHDPGYSGYSAEASAFTDPDITPPELSDVSAVAGDTVADVYATSNEGGWIYLFVNIDPDSPTQIGMLGGTEIPCSAGVPITYHKTGLTNATLYYAHTMAVDTAGNQSAIVKVGPFTPTTLSLDADIVAQWRLNGDVQDDSANNLDLTLQGTTAWGSGPLVGNSLDTRGAGYAAERSGLSQGIDGNPFTMSGWVYRTGTDGAMLWNNSAYNQPGFVFYIDGGTGIPTFVTVTTVRTGAALTLPLNTWTHLALTRGSGAGADLKFYVDGALHAAWTVPVFGNPAPYALKLPSLDGYIDDMRIYDVEKDITFISNLTSAGRQ